MLESAADDGRPLREEVYGEFGLNNMLKFMLRWDDYKYVYHTNGGQEALFNLANDPDELTNIAASHAGICEASRARLVQYYREHRFEEALDGERLKSYPYEPHKNAGFIDQRPQWTVPL
ncbi:hypothetical protein [Paenibacillus sp. GCM10027626]|uniref:hypothetical protein n=1 Tax=Paenibacillus sp. GCM10027626 TaxID=3273411 RepID=UPI00362EF499